MNLSLLFRDADELAAFCMSDNDAQDALLAERIAELARNGVVLDGMQCTIKDKQQ